MTIVSKLLKIAARLKKKSFQEADRDDAFLAPFGHLGSRVSLSAGGKFIGDYSNTEEAEKALVDWINKYKWSPDIWWIDDHGGTTPYKLSKQNARKIKMD